MKKILSKFIVAVCCSTVIFTSIASAFTDLSNSHWAYGSVNKMQERGIISGFEDGTFRPDEAVTREQFATILVKTLGLTQNTSTVSFVDVENDRWSKEFIDVASQYLTGYMGNGKYYFRPADMAVREDITVAIVKAKGLDNQTPDYSVLDKFSDKAAISEDLQKYVALAIQYGLMNGNANGTFNPQGVLTRAEITAVMTNVLEKVVIDDIEDKYTPEFKLVDGVIDLGENYEKCQVCYENYEGYVYNGNGIFRYNEGGDRTAWFVPTTRYLTDKPSHFTDGWNSNTLVVYVLDESGKEHEIRIAQIISNEGWLKKYAENQDEAIAAGKNKEITIKYNQPVELKGYSIDIYDKNFNRVPNDAKIVNDNELKVNFDFEPGETYTVVTNNVCTKQGDFIEEYQYSFDIKPEEVEENLPEFKVKNGAVELGKDYSKYQISYNTIEEPGKWYTPIYGETNGVKVSEQATGKIILSERAYWARECEYMFISEKVNDNDYTTLYIDKIENWGQDITEENITEEDVIVENISLAYVANIDLVENDVFEVTLLTEEDELVYETIGNIDDIAFDEGDFIKCGITRSGRIDINPEISYKIRGSDNWKVEIGDELYKVDEEERIIKLYPNGYKAYNVILKGGKLGEKSYNLSELAKKELVSNNELDLDKAMEEIGGFPASIDLEVKTYLNDEYSDSIYEYNSGLLILPDNDMGSIEDIGFKFNVGYVTSIERLEDEWEVTILNSKEESTYVAVGKWEEFYFNEGDFIVYDVIDEYYLDLFSSYTLIDVEKVNNLDKNKVIDIEDDGVLLTTKDYEGELTKEHITVEAVTTNSIKFDEELDNPVSNIKFQRDDGEFNGVIYDLTDLDNPEIIEDIKCLEEKPVFAFDTDLDSKADTFVIVRK